MSNNGDISGTGEKEQAQLALRARMTEERNGVTLFSSMVDCLLVTLSPIVSSIEDVDTVTDEEIAGLFEDAWKLKGIGDPIPLARTRMKTWAGLAPTSMLPSTNAALARMALGAQGDEASTSGINNAQNSRGMERGRITSYEDEISNDFPELSPKIHDMAVQDCVDQGLTGTEILALAASLETGRVHSVHEVAGMLYGMDPRAMHFVKAACKYDDNTFSKLLAAGKIRELAALVTGLAREYATGGYAQQAVLVSSWWTETQVGFENDKEGLVAYLKAYRRTYSGRGLPKNWDERMATRARNETRSNGGGMTREEVKNIVQSSTSKLADQIEKLTRENKDLRRNPRVAPPPGGGETETPAEYEKRLKGVKCYHCGKKGHLSRDCPEKKKEEEE